MTKDEAQVLLERTRKMYQPIHGFSKATDRKIEPFYKRIKAIADYCGHTDDYLICGCANGFSCFELAKLGARVVGVDMRDKWLDVARATAVYNDIHIDNPAFIHGKFPDWLYETTIRPDWTIMMMVLHNMLKFSPPESIFKMLNRVADISKKGLVITSRNRRWPVPYNKIPDYIVENTKFSRWEEVPCVRKEIAFGFPIWVFYE